MITATQRCEGDGIAIVRCPGSSLLSFAVLELRGAHVVLDCVATRTHLRHRAALRCDVELMTAECSPSATEVPCPGLLCERSIAPAFK